MADPDPTLAELEEHAEQMEWHASYFASDATRPYYRRRWLYAIHLAAIKRSSKGTPRC